MPLTTDTVSSSSVRGALRNALVDDGRLSHEDAVELIRSVLDKGEITREEKVDLRRIVENSKTLELRSRNLISNFLYSLSKSIGFNYVLEIPEAAANLVCDFLKRTGPGKFKHLDRDKIGLELLIRLSKPGLINQGDSSLCGPISLLFNLASDQPQSYVKFGIDLFERGVANIGKLKIEPGPDCRSFQPDFTKMDGVDWMMAASIRDSENAFFDYESSQNEFAGITLPGDLEDWFEAAGYTDVQNETNLVLNKGASCITEVNNLYQQKYRVCLFVGAKMLDAKTQTSGTLTPDHWVVMRSLITSTSLGVRFKVFSWGNGEFQIPQGAPLSEDDFLDNLYGYVAAKP